MQTNSAPQDVGVCKKTATPAVSVIIPTYNRADLLVTTLDSVAAQTFKDYEIVVVDDGSDDGTRELIESREQKIRYIWQENQGVAEARNHALRVSHAGFVAFLDSDDIWKPDFLERTVARLREHPEEDLVFTDFVSIDADGKVLRGHRKIPHTGDITTWLFDSSFIHTSSVVAKSKVLRDAGGFDGRLTHNEDYDLWLRLSLRYRFGLVPEPLCLRRYHYNSLSRKGCSANILLRKAELLQRFYEYGGGKEKILPEPAQKRLAKVYYTAAKTFFREGDPYKACQIFRESMRYDRTRFKTWIWYALAGVRRMV
ncbi:MAG: glycosyltransferase [Planctomycetota bacterium]|nr:MAG: glycosyltransferase [Planctomycetota bacterium]